MAPPPATALPLADLVGMEAMFGGQLVNRFRALGRIQGYLKLELSTVAFPFLAVIVDLHVLSRFYLKSTLARGPKFGSIILPSNTMDANINEVIFTGEKFTAYLDTKIGIIIAFSQNRSGTEHRSSPKAKRSRSVSAPMIFWFFHSRNLRD